MSKLCIVSKRPTTGRSEENFETFERLILSQKEKPGLDFREKL